MCMSFIQLAMTINLFDFIKGSKCYPDNSMSHVCIDGDAFGNIRA